MPKHTVIIRYKTIRLPGFRQRSSPISQLPSIPGDVIFGIHFINDIRISVFFQDSQQITITDISGGQSVITILNIINQVLIYNLPILFLHQSEIERNCIRSLTVTVILLSGSIIKFLIISLSDASSQLCKTLFILFLSKQFCYLRHYRRIVIIQTG